ncbi:hypothetical protein [Dactylococcopsis salina]|uniref:DUF1795 domain-containing protein n=1 Tax=Dactylococcopsis salina (strain PCC 8305) TaxID=13035 RepID=K9YU43_DACS8|nr:hypothetical protein [Dactylococcopsis salina]AFZ49628.1 hypothetical protein Dacsa_0895 [Dactylococcopsis salina PCC 8305]
MSRCKNQPKLSHCFWKNLLLVCLLFILSSCQDFSPKNPNVSSTQASLEAVTPQLKAFDLEAENWQTIKGEGVSLSLPKTYRGGNPLRDFTAIEEALKGLDQGYQKRLQAIKQNLDQIVFMAFDARSITPDALTNVNILKQPIEADVTLENYLETAVEALEKTHKIEGEIITTQGEKSLGRIIATVTTEEGVAMKQLFYFQPEAETMWITNYTTPESEFQNRVSNFEQSIASLKSGSPNQ